VTTHAFCSVSLARRAREIEVWEVQRIVKVEKADQFVCEVVGFKHLTPNVFELKFAPERPLQFQAGQYVSVLVPSADGKPLRRPYSVASAPETNPIELCVQRVEKGPGSNYLASLREGDKFECVAPYGFLTYHPRTDRHAVFVSTGTGIAPFRSMVLSEAFKKQSPLSTLFLLGVRSDEELLYAEDFQNASSVQWVPCLTRPGGKVPCFTGRVTQYLENEANLSWHDTEFYLCGNGAMIDDVRRFLKAKGVDRKSIHVEIYFRPEPNP
jgi:ferredoxin-NADP reductase